MYVSRALAGTGRTDKKDQEQTSYLLQLCSCSAQIPTLKHECMKLWMGLMSPELWQEEELSERLSLKLVGEQFLRAKFGQTRQSSLHALIGVFVFTNGVAFPSGISQETSWCIVDDPSIAQNEVASTKRGTKWGPITVHVQSLDIARHWTRAMPAYDNLGLTWWPIYESVYYGKPF